MSTLTTTARHGLAAPTVAEFRTAVQKAAGKDMDAVWTRLCISAGVPPTATTLTIQQLGSLAAAITSSPGVLGIMGRSLGVRLSSYRTTTALNGPQR